MRTLRVEAPTGQTLKAYLFPFSNEIIADPAGYSLVETETRQYEVEIVNPELVGTYRVLIEVVSGEFTNSIDSGYVALGGDAGTYVMTDIIPTIATASTSEVTLTDYGPKRVKTKEMEIEQFDPIRNQMASERATMNYPGWCSGYDCVGRYKNECP